MKCLTLFVIDCTQILGREIVWFYEKFSLFQQILGSVGCFSTGNNLATMVCEIGLTTDDTSGDIQNN